MATTSHSHHGYYPTPSQPISMPSKGDIDHHMYPYPQLPYDHISSSPPEGTETVSSGGPSYDPSAISGSYAASASDYESSVSGGVSSIDLLEFMNDRLQSSYDPLAMDKGLVQQVQTSAELNDKTQQLLELQALAQQRFAAMQASFTEGIKTAKEVQKDLDWTQKKVTSLNKRAARKYPREYSVAQDRYPSTMDY